mmetsp:Transcript_31560/g.92527  ORF Transcript_31560/g.92527 Transcript_31560/m.92527 type:complete len:566 (-) Transcript_31560:112-1809(-)
MTKVGARWLRSCRGRLGASFRFRLALAFTNLGGGIGSGLLGGRRLGLLLWSLLFGIFRRHELALAHLAIDLAPQFDFGTLLLPLGLLFGSHIATFHAPDKAHILELLLLFLGQRLDILGVVVSAQSDPVAKRFLLVGSAKFAARDIAIAMRVLVGLELLNTFVPINLLATGDGSVVREVKADGCKRRDALIGHSDLLAVLKALVVGLSLALDPDGQGLVLLERRRYIAVSMLFLKVTQLLILLLPVRRVDIELKADAVQLQNALVGKLILLPGLALLVLPPGGADPPSQLEILGVVGGDLAVPMLALVLDQLGVAQLPLLATLGADPEELLLGIAHHLGVDLLRFAVLQVRGEAGLTLEALMALGADIELGYEALRVATIGLLSSGGGRHSGKDLLMWHLERPGCRQSSGLLGSPDLLLLQTLGLGLGLGLLRRIKLARKGGKRGHGPGGRRGHLVGHGKVGSGRDGQAPSGSRGDAGRRLLHLLTLRLLCTLRFIVGLLAAARRRHGCWQSKEDGYRRILLRMCLNFDLRPIRIQRTCQMSELFVSDTQSKIPAKANEDAIERR